MSWPTAVLVAVALTVVTVQATLYFGPTGTLVTAAGFGAGYGLGLAAERVAGRSERHP